MISSKGKEMGPRVASRDSQGGQTRFVGSKSLKTDRPLGSTLNSCRGSRSKQSRLKLAEAVVLGHNEVETCCPKWVPFASRGVVSKKQ
jgi:hypothetical protein